MINKINHYLRYITLKCSWYLYRNTSTHGPAANHNPGDGLAHVHVLRRTSVP